MTELSFDSLGFFDPSKTKGSLQPRVANFDPKNVNSLFTKIQDLESTLDKKLSSLNEKERIVFNNQVDSIKARYLSKSKNQGFDEQELLVQAVNKKLLFNSSESPDDQDLKMFFNNVQVFNTFLLDGIPNPNSMNTSSMIRDYTQLLNSSQSIKIDKPPGFIYNLINFSGGIVLGGGFVAELLLRETSSLPSIFVANPALTAFSLISIGISLTDDFQKVIRYGDSVQRIPRNLIANILQGIVGQQTTIYILGAILGPLGIQSVIGYVVISAIVNLAAQSVTSFVVRKLVFRSQIDLELKAATDLAKKQEEIDDLFRQSIKPPLKKQGITDIKVYDSISKGFDLLQKPWAWTKENKTSVLLAGIGFIIYKRSNVQLIKSFASSFPNSLINLILVQGFNGLPIRDYSEKILQWISKKIDITKFLPNFLARLSKRIEDYFKTKISSIAIASVFLEAITKTFFNTQVVTSITLQNLESISFNKSLYSFFAFLENLEQVPSDITKIFDYLRDFPSIVQGGDIIYQEKEDGSFEKAYLVSQDNVSIADLKTGESKSIIDFKNENAELLKSLFVSREGLKTAVFYSLEELNKIGIKDTSILSNAFKAGYPKSKIDQFFSVVETKTKEIEDSKINLVNTFNIVKTKIDESEKKFRFLFDSYRQIQENEFITLDELKAKARLLIDSNDNNIKGYLQEIERSNDLTNAENSLDKWYDTFVLKNIRLLSQQLEDTFEIYEDGLKVIENKEKLLRNIISEAIEKLDTFSKSKPFNIPLTFNQVQIDSLTKPLTNDVEFKQSSNAFSAFPSFQSVDSVQSKTIEITQNPTDQLLSNPNSFDSSFQKPEIQKLNVQGFDEKTSLSIREIQKNTRELTAALEYGISHSQSLNTQISLQTQLNVLNKLKDLFSKGSTLTPDLIKTEEIQSLFQTYESQYKESLDTLKRVNPNIPSNCFFDLTGVWEARKSQDGKSWIVVDSKTAKEVPSACVSKPIFSNLYNLSRSILKKVLFLAGNKSGPLIAEVFFQSFDSIVLDIAKTCSNRDNKGFIHTGACLINSLFVQAICANNPSLCPELNEYAFIDTREFVFGNYKTFGSLISFLPQVTKETVDVIGSSTSSSLNASGKLLNTFSERQEALEELEVERSKELEKSYFSFVVDSKFFIKRQLQNLSDTATSITTAFNLSKDLILNFSKLSASLTSAIAQVGLQSFVDNPEFLSQAVFGSKRLSSLRDSWDEFEQRFLSTFGKDITTQDRISVYTSSFYSWIQLIISRLDLVVEGLKNTFNESIYFIDFVRSSFCSIFIAAALLCSPPSVLEGLRETQGYQSINENHSEFFQSINTLPLVKQFFVEFQEPSALLIPNDQQFKELKRKFEEKNGPLNENKTLEFIKSFIYPTNESLNREKLESIDFSKESNLNGNDFSFKRITIDAIRYFGQEKTFGSENVQIYFVNLIQ